MKKIKLYKIWWISSRWGWSRTMESFLTVVPYFRDEVVSINLPKLEKLCERLNLCKDEDEYYEIRCEEKSIDDY